MESPFTHSDLHQLIEEYTTNTGKTLESIAENPFVKSIHKVFGFRWLGAIIGEIDTESVQTKVAQLKNEYPHETPIQLVQRTINLQTLEAAKLGFLSNLIPPFALALFGWELAGMTKLQAEMLYQIAAIHNFDLKHPSRRGEALAIFGLSLGGEGIKTGLSVLEVLPGIGAITGASSNAILIYSLGLTAHQFYHLKNKSKKL
jgi:uncharacterized protein (DUF697 family)